MDSNSLRFKCQSDNRPIKVFFEDEARFGRIDNPSRCWSPKNIRARVGSQIVREYLHAFACVCPQTGETNSLILNDCDTEMMNLFLEDTSLTFPDNRNIMIVDGAGWHRSKDLIIPENIVLWSLPPYSPELNPVEHIWDYIREQKGFKNKTFVNLEEVENKLCIALNEVYQEKEIISKMTNFSWIHS